MSALYEYARWLYVDRQIKKQFDSISAGHEAFMLSQGLISSIEKKEEKGPKCPFLFIGTMEKYRELKFIQRETSDNITIYPRDMLKWSDVAAYKEVTGQKISLLEAELIMGIDAVFEGREDQS